MTQDVNSARKWEEDYERQTDGWDLGGPTPAFKRLISSRQLIPGRMIVLGAGVGTEVRIATFYYPFWKATVNGNSAEVERLDDGTIGVSIPPGAAGIRLYFEPPAYETASWYFSLTTWLVLLSFLIFTLAKMTRRGQLA